MIKISSLTGSDLATVVRLAKALQNMHEKAARFEEGLCSRDVLDNAEDRLNKAQDALQDLEHRVGAVDYSDIYEWAV